MRLPHALVMITLGMSSLACTVGEGDDLDATSADATAVAVDWIPWEEPVTLALDEPASAEVAYGQCVSVEPEEGVDVAIECGTPWSEVAWYVLSADALAEGGGDELVVRFATEDVARGAIHAVSPGGEKKKLAVGQSLFDGDELNAPVLEGYDYHVYVARGRTLELLWFDGTVAFTLVAETRTGQP